MVPLSLPFPNLDEMMDDDDGAFRLKGMI